MSSSAWSKTEKERPFVVLFLFLLEVGFEPEAVDLERSRFRATREANPTRGANE